MIDFVAKYFNLSVKESADKGMTYDKNISVGNGRFCRRFRGVHVKVRTKDVNY